MNEQELFAAYRESASEEWKAALERARREQDMRLAKVQCMVPNCMTMIDVQAMRSMCRFHSSSPVLREPRPKGAMGPSGA